MKKNLKILLATMGLTLVPITIAPVVTSCSENTYSSKILPTIILKETLIADKSINIYTAKELIGKNANDPIYQKVSDFIHKNINELFKNLPKDAIVSTNTIIANDNNPNDNTVIVNIIVSKFINSNKELINDKVVPIVITDLKQVAA